MSDTQHRRNCERPGWLITASRTIRDTYIARCTGCGAVELRKKDNA